MKKGSWLILIFFAVTVINYPNPFNPLRGELATIECTSDITSEAMVYLYDLSARLLWQQNFSLQGGQKNLLTWSGFGNNNELAGNGIYLYRLIDHPSKNLLAKGKIWVLNQ